MRFWDRHIIAGQSHSFGHPNKIDTWNFKDHKKCFLGMLRTANYLKMGARQGNKCIGNSEDHRFGEQGNFCILGQLDQNI